MLPERTGPDDHHRTEIGLIYQLFEDPSAAQDERELETDQEATIENQPR